MKRSIATILIALSGIGPVLAQVGPPPNPMSIPLDGGVSVILIGVGAYIGYKALKKDE